MVDELIAVLCCNAMLNFFDVIIDELDDVSGFDADHVIVVIPAVQFKNGMPAFEIVAHDEPQPFKLREHPVDRGQTNIFAGIQKFSIDILRAQMASALLSRISRIFNRGSVTFRPALRNS